MFGEEKSLAIDGERFELLGRQRGGAAVYRGESSYLRMGPKEIIAPDLALHKAMEKLKFPVAKLKSEGEIGDKAYFVEASLGERSFRAIFQEDYSNERHILDENFQSFIKVLRKLYAVQVKTSEKQWNIEEFAAGIHLPVLSAELPTHSAAITRRFEESVERLKKLPGALTHGDCNPANVYEGGIIDLEDSFRGPLGYDIVSALMSIEWSPDTHEYEFFAQYRFSDEQKQGYIKTLSALGQKNKAPNLALYFDDLAFCRAVWLCSGMHEWPRLQQWRFDKFVKTYLT